jgi:hypothetical protein
MALSDPRRYVYEALTGTERLFNLTADPRETVDLASLAQHNATLAIFRRALVTQFESEERGTAWVRDGELVPHRAGQLYSPNYPASPQPTLTAVS